MCVSQVFCDDASSQAVFCGIGSVDRLLQSAELQDLLARTEDLLAGDRVVILHVREHRRLNEETVAGVAPDLTAGLQFGALLNTGLHQGEDLLELSGVDLRTLLGGVLKRIAHFALLGQLNAALHELIVDRLVHERSTARTAHLTLVEEHRLMRDLNCQVQIGIRTYDVWAFAAQLQGDSLDVGRRRDGLDVSSDHRAAGERNFVDLRMQNKWLSSGFAVTCERENDERGA